MIFSWKAFAVKNLDTLVNTVGIAYGLLLILAVFVRTSVTESLRVDALFMKQASEQTRPLNLIVGVLVAGYAIYSLL